MIQMKGRKGIDSMSKECERRMKNGAALMEKLIAFSNGIYNPIRIYSAEELWMATDGYNGDLILRADSHYTLYKGILGDRLISVKQFDGKSYWGASLLYEMAINEIVIGSQMSSHKNVLKLVGCCLETEIPIIVYELLVGEVLSRYLSEKYQMKLKPLCWKHRLKIAREIANAIAYLHTAFPVPVVHRDIKCYTIFLGEDYSPKLIDCSLSISIPQGKTHVEDAWVGAIGHVDPLYVSTYRLSQKADVYSFGVLLLALLTGQHNGWMHFKENMDDARLRIENNELTGVEDSILLGEGVDEERLLALAKLAFSCLSSYEEDRPTMVEVAKRLKIIERLVPTNLSLGCESVSLDHRAKLPSFEGGSEDTRTQSKEGELFEEQEKGEFLAELMKRNTWCRMPLALSKEQVAVFFACLLSLFLFFFSETVFLPSCIEAGDSSG